MPNKIDYQQRYFDDKFANIEARLNELKIGYGHKVQLAESAHKRLDALENRAWGVAVGSSLGGGALVSFVQYFLQTLPK